MFKCYKAFTSFGYRIFIFCIYPLLAVMGCVLFQTGFFGTARSLNYMSCMILISVGICTMEIISDLFPFGGIMSKKYSLFDLLKTSDRGMQSYRKVLVFDSIRRFVYIVVINVFNVLFGVVVLGDAFIAEFVPTFIFIGISIYFLCTVAICITRLSSFIVINYLASYIAIMLDMLLIYYYSNSSLSNLVNIIIILLLCVVANVVMVWLYKKELEAGYND